MQTYSIRIAVAAMAACFSTAAVAQDWADWDLDEDRAYSEEEFGAGLGESGIFNTFVCAVSAPLISAVPARHPSGEFPSEHSEGAEDGGWWGRI